MAKHLTRKELARLETLYKNGEPIQEIAHRLKVSIRTVHYQASTNQWEHGEKKKEYQNKLAIREGEGLLKEGLGKAEDLRESYFRKIQVLENMTSAALRGLGSTPEEIRGISQTEANRIFTVLKSLKISSEISNLHYESARKALGLDQISDDDSEVVLPIKINVSTKQEIMEDEDDDTEKDNEQ